MEKRKILIVDDDANIAELIALYLTKECFQCEIAEDGETALEKHQSFQPDLILLDIMSAKVETFDKVLGLELGADDYIIKPFEPKEVVARVKAVLRRFDNQQAIVASAAKDTPKDVVTYDGLVISLANYSVTDHEKTIEMPPKEMELLYFLASHPNQVFTREQLLDQIWGYEYIGETRTVDVHIKRIREKLTENPAWSLTTVWGIGYKFEVNA